MKQRQYEPSPNAANDGAAPTSNGRVFQARAAAICMS